MFGEIDFIVVNSSSKKKKGNALVSFKDSNSAIEAARQTLGDPDNRLIISLVNAPSASATSTKPATTPTPARPVEETPKPLAAPSLSVKDHLSFEDAILKKMMLAAQQKQ